MPVSSNLLLQGVGDLALLIDGTTIKPSPAVHNVDDIPGVLIDIQTTHEISHRNWILSLTNSDAERLLQALIISRLDYCNGVLSSLSNTLLDRLQHTQDSAARVLTHTRPHQLLTHPSDYSSSSQVLD